MTTRIRPYKDLTLRQLRSFCETVRLGSLKAAAGALGLESATVWAQVHALERELGTKLIETSTKGCRPTADGELLEELIGRSVEDIRSLKRRFQESRGETPMRLTVAATPRIVVEDLPDCVLEFERLYPHIQLTLTEMSIEDVNAAVESGEVDVGLNVDTWPQPRNPRLIFEPCYEVDSILVTPKDHPLARRRRVRPKDLRDYPVVNSPKGIRYQGIAMELDKLGVFKAKPRRVEAFYTAAICRYVELGFGIGFVIGLLSRKPHPNLHERSMSRYFGRLPIYLVWRRRALPQEPAGAFAETLKTLLDRKPGRK